MATKSSPVGKLTPPRPKHHITLTDDQLLTVVEYLQKAETRIKNNQRMAEPQKSWRLDRIRRTLKAVTK